MARKPRVHYAEAVYHVIARGNNRQIVFKDDGDKLEYLFLIRKYMLKFNFILYAYVLMNNHAHLLIKINEEPLAKIMQGMQLTYTKYFNLKYGNTGHVFEQRYKAMICKDSNHLLTLIKYIHNNPVKANLCENLFYTWSSHKYYMAGSKGFVDAKTPLSILDTDQTRATGKYLALMNSSKPEISFEELDDATIDCPGEIPDCEEPLLFDKARLTVALRKSNPNLSLDRLISVITGDLQINKEVLFSGSRQRKVVHTRNLIIYLALNHAVCERREICELFKISNSMITRACQSVTTGDNGFLALVKRVEKILLAE